MEANENSGSTTPFGRGNAALTRVRVPGGQRKIGQHHPFCRGKDAAREYKRSTVIVLRVFLAPAEAYGASLAPRRAAQAGARLTLPGSSFEPNGGAPRCAMHRRGVFC